MALRCNSVVPLIQLFLRAFGPTATQPCLEQISVASRAPPPGSRYASPDVGSVTPHTDLYKLTGLTPFSVEPIHDGPGAPLPRPGAQNGEAGNPDCFPDSPYDDNSDLPRAPILQELLPLFFSRMGSHFPFLTESLVMGDIDHGDPSRRVTAPLLINAICALASR